MLAASLSVGLQRVDAAFCRGSSGMSGGGLIVACLSSAQGADEIPTLSCTWELPVHTFRALARVDIAASVVDGLELRPCDDDGQTLVRFTLNSEPRLSVGSRAVTRSPRRRLFAKTTGATSWLRDSACGNAAMPPLLRASLLRERSLELMVASSLSEVWEKFASAWPHLLQPGRATSNKGPIMSSPVSGCGETPAAERTPAPRLASTADGTPLKLARPSPHPTSGMRASSSGPSWATLVPASEEVGSNGEQCDWCGMTPADGEAALKVCGACLYSCCEQCSAHKTKGACYCKSTRGTTRRRLF